MQRPIFRETPSGRYLKRLSEDTFSGGFFSTDRMGQN
jgi:hypothetical protein